jgi:uncharacterized protein with von Willebrand factor type A (vWA) domain
MFADFLYTLRRHEVHVSLTEWMTLLTALDKGLAKNSLTRFYYLSRAIVTKTEQEYDNFDLAFLEYFKDIRPQDRLLSNLTNEFHQNKADPLRERPRAGGRPADNYNDVALTGSAFLPDVSAGGALEGMAGTGLEGGMQMPGDEMAKSSFDLAGSRTFRDFRDDNIINERQFQVVLRRLRQLSSHMDVPESELDVDATIRKTSDKGGILHIAMKRPRRNIIKLMLLMDSGGSMQTYSKFCTALFQAAMKSNSFQDLKIYYFHNCIYNNLYSDPTCGEDSEIATEWVLRNIGSDYKVIIVGDAAMSPLELSTANYRARLGEPSLSGMAWMKLVKKKYRKIVWLNPEEEDANWRDSFTRKWLEAEFDSYLFTLKNFAAAMKKLLKG